MNLSFFINKIHIFKSNLKKSSVYLCIFMIKVGVLERPKNHNVLRSLPCIRFFLVDSGLDTL